MQALFKPCRLLHYPKGLEFTTLTNLVFRFYHSKTTRVLPYSCTCVQIFNSRGKGHRPAPMNKTGRTFLYVGMVRWLVTHKVKTQQVVKSRGQHCGDIELAGYLANEAGPVPLVLDLRIAHDRVGRSTVLTPLLTDF
jgi:hypothetical protein